MDHNTIIFLIIILLFFSVFILCSCAPQQLRQQALDQQQATVDAKGASSEIHLKYLMCYALNPKEKQVCTKDLVSKYIPKDR